MFTLLGALADKNFDCDGLKYKGSFRRKLLNFNRFTLILWSNLNTEDSPLITHHHHSDFVSTVTDLICELTSRKNTNLNPL